MTAETPLLHRLMLAFTNIGDRLFRNQVGEGWYGKTRYVGKGPIFGKPIVTIENPRRLVAGLCTGSSDLIGWHSIEITPEMVGRRIAVFTAIEGKTGRTQTTEEQGNFLDAVRAGGGIALLVRDESGIDEAVQAVKDWPARICVDV